jgi:ribosome-associated protein
MMEIPENELEIKFVRSSGPGGQKVNKTSSKAQLRWNINDSKIFTGEEKERIQTYLHTRRPSLITKENDIIIECDEERHQPKNKEIAIWRLNELINRALKKEKKRFPTKPSRAAKERRLEEKKRKSEIKKARQKIKYW